MNKKEFLLQQTRDVTEIFEKHGSYSPTFAILYEDGTTNSVATSFNGLESKDAFNSMMRKLCENPKVISSVFTFEVWVSKSALETSTKPSERSDRETHIVLIYNTRVGVHETYIYKPDINGKLQFEAKDTSANGRFSNPFGINELTAKAEKEKAIFEFQKQIRDSLCQGFEEIKKMPYVSFFLSNTPEQVSVQVLTEDEWLDKISLKHMIQEKCRDHLNLAFMLSIPEASDKVSIILVSEKVQEKYQYKINPSNHSLEFESKASYVGEFSGMFKNHEDKN